MSGAIRLERDGALARITVDRPERANALDTRLLVALRETFDSLHADPVPAVVILRGGGEKAFVGGADLSELATLDTASAKPFITKVHEACDAARRCPAPVIARLRGHALGAGLELAAACDLRIACDDAQFGMPEVRFGIPSVVEAALLPGLIGRGRTAWLLLTGKLIDARTALDWGFVERVASAESLDAAIAETVEAICEMEPHAVREQKRLLNYWDAHPLAEGIAESIESFKGCYAKGEPARRIGAFLDARRIAKRNAR